MDKLSFGFKWKINGRMAFSDNWRIKQKHLEKLRMKKKICKPLCKLACYIWWIISCSFHTSLGTLMEVEASPWVDKIKCSVSFLKKMLVLPALNMKLWKLRQGRFHCCNLPTCLLHKSWIVLLVVTGQKDFICCYYHFFQLPTCSYKLVSQSRTGEGKTKNSTTLAHCWGILPEYW